MEKLLQKIVRCCVSRIIGPNLENNNPYTFIKKISDIWQRNKAFKKTSSVKNGYVSAHLQHWQSSIKLLEHQKSKIHFVNKILESLEEIKGFDFLKKQLGTHDGYDDQLMASFYYQQIFGLNEIEIVIDRKENWDFSFITSGITHYVEVKSLTQNITNYTLKCLSIVNKIRSVILQNTNNQPIFPELKCDPECIEKLFAYKIEDWRGELSEHDFSKRYLRTGYSIDFRRADCDDMPVKTVLPELNILHFFPNLISEITNKISRQRAKNERFIALIIIPPGTAKKIIDTVDNDSKLSDQIYDVWKDACLDGVIFLSYTDHFLPLGCRFDVYEQHKFDRYFICSENGYFEEHVSMDGNSFE